MTILETQELTRRFGGLAAVNRISLSIQAGQVRSIIGPNGAGKTTLFNLITGALAPTAGTIVFRGRDITGLAPPAIFRLGIVRSFQISQVFPKLTARENVALMAWGRVRTSGSPFARARATADEVDHRVDAVLDQVGLAERADQLAGTLAHGDRRLLEIAMALAAGPELLLLDEPTAGMSPEETKQTALLLRSLAPDITLVIVEHDMSVVMAISDRISVLHRGELLAEGPPEEIRANPDVQAVYLGGAPR
jgi:branched-chain amino acid transport system ATP-binding protein